MLHANLHRAGLVLGFALMGMSAWALAQEVVAPPPAPVQQPALPPLPAGPDPLPPTVQAPAPAPISPFPEVKKDALPAAKEGLPIPTPPLPEVKKGSPPTIAPATPDLLMPQKLPLPPETFPAPKRDSLVPAAFKRLDDPSGNPAPAQVALPGAKVPAFRVIGLNKPKESTSLKPLVPPNEPVLKALPPGSANLGSAQTPSLTVDKVGPSSVRAGQPFTYEIVVRNVGFAPGAQARLDDELPPGTLYLGAQPAPQVEKNRLSWVVIDLAPGLERRFKVQVQSQSVQDWKGNATLTVTAGTGLKTQVLRPPLTVTMTGPEAVELGQKAMFAIRVANNSTEPIIGKFLKAKLPAGLEHVQGNDIEADLGILAPGETRTLDLECVTTRAGRHAAMVIVANKEGVGIPAEALLEVREPEVVLHLVKPERIPANQPVALRLEIENRSAQTLKDVRVRVPSMNSTESLITLAELPAGKRHTVGFGQELPGPGGHEVAFEFSHGEGQRRTWTFVIQAERQ